jgi:hypothetical protein
MLPRNRCALLFPLSFCMNAHQSHPIDHDARGAIHRAATIAAPSAGRSPGPVMCLVLDFRQVISGKSVTKCGITAGRKSGGLMLEIRDSTVRLVTSRSSGPARMAMSFGPERQELLSVPGTISIEKRRFHRQGWRSAAPRHRGRRRPRSSRLGGWRDSVGAARPAWRA